MNPYDQCIQVLKTLYAQEEESVRAISYKGSNLAMDVLEEAIDQIQLLKDNCEHEWDQVLPPYYLSYSLDWCKRCGALKKMYSALNESLHDK